MDLGGAGGLGGMLSGLSFSSLVAGLVFSGVGFVAFVYGKKTMNVRLMLIGGALSTYCFFITDTLWVCLIGIALSAAAYSVRNSE